MRTQLDCGRSVNSESYWRFTRQRPTPDPGPGELASMPLHGRAGVGNFRRANCGVFRRARAPQKIAPGLLPRVGCRRGMSYSSLVRGVLLRACHTVKGCARACTVAAAPGHVGLDHASLIATPLSWCQVAPRAHPHAARGLQAASLASLPPRAAVRIGSSAETALWPCPHLYSSLGPAAA